MSILLQNYNSTGEYCYNGDLDNEWLKTVQSLNHLHDIIYPQILEKGVRGNWKKVHSDYPEVDGVAASELNPGYEALEFIRKHQDKINPEKGTREEKSALDVAQTTEKFLKICRSRANVHLAYQTFVSELTNLSTKEFNSSVVLLKVRFQKAKDPKQKEKYEEDIIGKYDEFEKAKKKSMEVQALFKNASSRLAREEDLHFNVSFNRNEYLNYLVFERDYRIRGVTLEVYLQDQEVLWSDVLSYLTETPAEHLNPPQEQAAGLETMVKTLTESLNSSKNSDLERSKDKAVERVNIKLKLFRELCKEAKDTVLSAGLEELQSTVRELKGIQRELKEAQFDPNIEMSSETKEFLKEKTSFIREINKQIETLKQKKEDEESKRKNEMSANLRSMESIKLLPLTGPEDFIAWKKNQLKLNSHTDPYKKAAALLATIKSPEDRSMLINIDDWDKMLSLLNEKYNHQEKLVPALKNKLDSLPHAQTDDQMLQNYRTTINIYEQLCAMGCKESFDGTVVYNLQQKMTTDAKKNFERFKLRRKELENMQQDPNYTFDETEGILDASVDLSSNPQDLKVVDRSPEVRRLFLLFIKEESKLLEFTKEEKKMQAAEKCKICKQVQMNCKCKKKININTVNTKEGCPLCGEKLHRNLADRPTKSVARCPKFKSLSLEMRKNYIGKSNSCYFCLTPGHQTADCRLEGKCNNCQKERHHHLLCEPKSESVEVHTCGPKGTTTFLKVTQVKMMFQNQQSGPTNSNFKYVNVLWDSGAGCHLITNKLARKLRYAGEPTNVQISTLGEYIHKGHKPFKQPKEFQVKIMDNQNQIHTLECYGLEKVQNRRAPINKNTIEDCAKRFGISSSEISNPKGEIDMIIGIEHNHLAPRQVGEDPCGLGLYSTNFGQHKYILAGRTSPKKVDINNVEAKASSLTRDPHGPKKDSKFSTCFKARSKDVDTISSPDESNKFIAEKMANKLKRALKKDGLLETYTDNFVHMEARGAEKEPTEEETEFWRSRVPKDSKSTTCGSVLNNSPSGNGTSLNDKLPKYPKAIFNLLLGFMLMFVAGHRLVPNVLDESDSILDSIQEGFNTKDIFVINRISQIRKAAQKMNSEVKYYHILTELNIAEWQHGPDFIKDLEAVAKLEIQIKPEENILDNLLKRSYKLRNTLRAICILKSILRRKYKSKREKQDEMKVLIKKTQEASGVETVKIKQLPLKFKETKEIKFYKTNGVTTHVLRDPMSTFISGDWTEKLVSTEEESEFEDLLKRKYNIKWVFIPPGSQWRDPAERSIKSLKEMMQTIFNTEHNKSVLTINEYWSIFSQCAEILNRRPIQGYMDDETLKFICPNQLILGRTAKEAPAYSKEDLETRPRLELLQGIKAEFWKRLMNVLAADSKLMKYPCWYGQSREPLPGDVVLVLYKSKVNDSYRIGVIEKVDKNKRDITCFVSPCQDGTMKNFKKGAKMDIPVQRTILLYSPAEKNS